MTRRASQCLCDIAGAIDAIRRFVGSRDRAEYLADEMCRRAVERMFDVVGEAARRLRDEDVATFASCPELSGAIAFRNFLTHVYDDIDDGRVCETIVTRLDPLRREIDAAREAGLETP